MRRNELAINVFERFIEENGRIPDYKEFMDLGYCKATYYNVKNFYLEKQAKKAIKEALRNEMGRGKF